MAIIGPRVPRADSCWHAPHQACLNVSLQHVIVTPSVICQAHTSTFNSQHHSQYLCYIPLLTFHLPLGWGLFSLILSPACSLRCWDASPWYISNPLSKFWIFFPAALILIVPPFYKNTFQNEKFQCWNENWLFKDQEQCLSGTSNCACQMMMIWWTYGELSQNLDEDFYFTFNFIPIQNLKKCKWHQILEPVKWFLGCPEVCDEEGMEEILEDISHEKSYILEIYWNTHKWQGQTLLDLVTKRLNSYQDLGSLKSHRFRLFFSQVYLAPQVGVGEGRVVMLAPRGDWVLVMLDIDRMTRGSLLHSKGTPCRVRPVDLLCSSSPSRQGCCCRIIGSDLEI